MEPDHDIRTKALLDQLTEIDQRILESRGQNVSKKERILRTGLLGVFVVLLALSASNLESPGVSLAIPAAVLMVGSFSTGPLIRLFHRRKLERERDRVLALYDEIDRRVALGSGDWRGEDDLS